MQVIQLTTGEGNINSLKACIIRTEINPCNWGDNRNYKIDIRKSE